MPRKKCGTCTALVLVPVHLRAPVIVLHIIAVCAYTAGVLVVQMAVGLLHKYGRHCKRGGVRLMAFFGARPMAFFGVRPMAFCREINMYRAGG